MNDNEILNQIKDLANRLQKRGSHILEAVNDIQSGWLDECDRQEFDRI